MRTSIESLAIEQLNEAISAIDKRTDTHGSAGRTLVRAAKVCRTLGLVAPWLHVKFERPRSCRLDAAREKRVFPFGPIETQWDAIFEVTTNP